MQQGVKKIIILESEHPIIVHQQGIPTSHEELV